jgi:hypothetical protein
MFKYKSLTQTYFKKKKKQGNHRRSYNKPEMEEEVTNFTTLNEGNSTTAIEEATNTPETEVNKNAKPAKKRKVDAEKETEDRTENDLAEDDTPRHTSTRTTS